MNDIQKYFDVVLDTVRSGIFLVNSKRRIELCNEYSCKIFNKLKSEIIGATISDIVAQIPGIEPLSLKQSKKISIYKGVYFVHTRLIKEKEEIIGEIFVLEDVTEQELLKKLNHQLDSIIESSYDAIYIADGSGNGTKVNQAYERMTGVKPEELLGKNMKQVVKEGIVSDSVTLKVMETKKPLTIMQTIRGKEVLVTGNPVFDENDTLINVVTNIRDLTELNFLKKDLEKEKALSNKYFNELIELRGKGTSDTDGIIAQSEKMKKVITLTKRVAKVDSNILILGESGVGKEVIARLLHEHGNRRTGPFIKVNCGAIPYHLLESELFGYEAGAFTGANKQGKPGLFEQADQGTIFLDEIGELALDLQVKLLRVIQELEVTRLGGAKTIHVNVRVIAATNRDLQEMVKKGSFRQDLFYRLNIVPIKIPPLRERKSDIIPLTYFFLNKCNQKYGMSKKLSHEALHSLKFFEWLGNIRELENFIERLVVTVEEDLIQQEHFPDDMVANKELGKKSINRPLKAIMNEVEKDILSKSLKELKTTRKAAEVLGIDQSTLVRKMQRLGVSYSGK